MRTIIEYMQLCHIHLYQKIARKKVVRVNAALGSFHYNLSNLDAKSNPHLLEFVFYYVVVFLKQTPNQLEFF